MKKRLIKGDHPFIATSFTSVANIYSALGNNDKAVEYSMASLDMTKQLLNDDQKVLVQSLSNIGKCFSELGINRNCLNYSNQSLCLVKKHCKGEHSDISKSLHDVDLVYYSRFGSNLNKKLEYPEKSQEMKKDLLQGDQPDMVLLLKTIELISMSLRKKF